MTDRLGSVRVDGDGVRSNYYPYGQEIQATSNGRTKFGTYYRDTPGLDYAEQRYYTSASGRFLTPDPGRSANPQSPGGWNRYAYTRGDPINHYDPTGMDDINAGCAAFDDAFCDGSSLMSNDPMNTGVPAPPGSINVFCSSLVYDFVGVSGVCTISPEQYEELVDYGPPAPTCPPQYRAWIGAHGADAVATGLSEANILATSAIESGWGRGPFVKGNSFFNLETLWKPGTEKPDPKYAYQVSWMQATEPFASGPHKGWFSLVASYSSAADSFKSFAATLGKYLSGVTDSAKFASILVAHGINAGRASYFGSIMQTFQDCLGTQK